MSKKSLQPTSWTANLVLLSTIAVIGTLCLTAPAFAQVGGLSKVNAFMDNVLSILRGVSITIVTIAIMLGGYKFLFKHADIAECAKILAGGLLIGGAAEIARFMLA